jgi:tol-pal system protein YbgF
VAARGENFASRGRASYHQRVRNSSAGLLAGVLLAAAVPACGGPMAQLRTDKQALTDDVDHLRAELRGERRKRQDLENQVLVLKDQLDTAKVRGAASAQLPRLPVEVLSPDDVPENGQLVGLADDGSQIVYLDDANRPPVAIDPSSIGGADEPAPRPRPRRAPPPPPDLDDLPTSTELEAGVKVVDLPIAPPRRVAPLPTPTTPPAAQPRRPAPVAADPDAADQAAALYRRGLAALKSHEYAAAVDALREVVSRYPRHELADNAQYWLGEAFYDQKDYTRALAEFRSTVTAYPRGNKVADALLKVGFAYQALGEPTKARATLEQVVTLYPGTTTATLAAGRLESLP